MKSKNTITRSPKNRENPYVQIARVALRDKNLSWKARGILSYILTNSDTWKIYVSELQNHSDKDGRESTANGIKELIDCGYIIRRRCHEKGTGKFKGYEYEVSDQPVNGLSVNGSAVNGKTVNGLSVNGKPEANRDVKEGDVNEEKIEKQKKVRRFSPPTLSECVAFFESKGEAPAEGESFFYFYESKNWYVGKNKMKSWPSAASGWISRNKKNRASAGSKKEKNNEIANIEYD